MNPTIFSLLSPRIQNFMLLPVTFHAVDIIENNKCCTFELTINGLYLLQSSVKQSPEENGLIFR